MAKSKARYLADVLQGDGSLVFSGDLSVPSTFTIDPLPSGAGGSVTIGGDLVSTGGLGNASLENSSITINSYNTALGGTVTLVTDDVLEGGSPTNLYYTDDRVNTYVAGGSLGNIVTTGYIRGPSTFTIDPATHGDNTGTVVIAGDLQVDGTTTTINSTTLTVDDLNITLASGAANAAAANGAGLTVDGASATITYDATNDEWDFNKPLNVTGAITSGTITVTAGNVGIGTSSPSFPLHSVNASTSYVMAETTGTGTSAGFRMKGDASADFTLFTTQGTNQFAIYDNSNTAQRLTIDSSGNVGIGTTVPAVSLHVDGTNASIGVIGTPKSDWYTTAYNGLQVADSLTLWGRASDSHMSGNYYVKDVSGVANDSYINNGYAHDLWFDNNSGDLNYRNAPSGSADAQITSWSTRLVIKSDGKVAINHGLGGGGINSQFNVFADGEAIRLDGTANTSRTLRFRNAATNGSGNAIITSDGILQIKTEDANAHIYINSVRDIAMQTTSLNGTAGNFTFSSYNTEIMRIDGANNRVGIGTDSPNQLLHLSGNGPVLALGSSGTSDPRIDFYDQSTTTIGAGIFLDQDQDTLRILRTVSGSATDGIAINASGNVGIGTTSPSDRLVVQKDSANIEPILVLKNDNTTDDNGTSIDFSGKDTSGNNIIYGRIASKYTNHATEKSHMIFTHRNDSGTFSEWMRVTHDGNVGIGTTSPAAKLQVTRSTSDTAGKTIYADGTQLSAISTNSTNYLHNVWIENHNFDIDSGVTDSGYRIGLNIEGYHDSSVFEGTLDTQKNIWSRNGNNSSGTGTITNSYNLHLETLSGGGLTITNNYGLYQSGAGTKNYFEGNVGIGTISPSFKLHVSHDGGGDASFTGGILVENTGTTTGEPNLAFKNQATGSNYWFTGLNQDTNYALTYGPTFEDPYNLFTLTSGGNLGVGGDPDPNERLVVTGSANGGSTAIVVQNEYSLASSVDESTDLQFRFYNAASGSHSSGAMIRSTKTEDWMTTAATSAELVFYTREDNVLAPKMTILPSGNVGIAHTSPKSKLSIVGDGTLNTYSGTIGIENTASDKWASITLTDDIDTASASSNYYLIGRGNTYADRYLSFHIPTATNYGSGSQPKFVFASSGADLLYTVEASTGDAYHKGNVGIGTPSPDGKLEVAVTEGDPGLLVSSTSQGTIVNITQTIQCMNQLSGSNVWHDVAFIGHSCTINVIGKSIENNDPAFAGASATATVSVQYGVGSVTQHHQQWATLNGGNVTGNMEYRYLNSGASSGSYRLQVRMPYTGGTQRIYTSITGVSVSYMFEDT